MVSNHKLDVCKLSRETYNFLEASRMWQRTYYGGLLQGHQARQSCIILYPSLDLQIMNVFCLHLFVHLCFGSTTCWANWIWGYPCRPLVPLGGFLRHCFRCNAKQLVLAMKMAAQNKLRRDPALERVSCWLRVHFPACQQDDFLGAWFNLWDMILRRRSFLQIWQKRHKQSGARMDETESPQQTSPHQCDKAWCLFS